MAIAVLKAIKRDAKVEIHFTKGDRFAPFFAVCSIYFSMKNTVSPSMRLNLWDFLISCRSSGLRF